MEKGNRGQENEKRQDPILSDSLARIKERYSGGINMARGKDDALILSVAKISSLHEHSVGIKGPVEYVSEEGRSYYQWVKSLTDATNGDWTLMKKLVGEEARKYRQEEKLSENDEMGTALLNLARSI